MLNSTRRKADYIWLRAGPALANIGLGEESKMASENHLKFRAKLENWAFKERKFLPMYFHG